MDDNALSRELTKILVAQYLAKNGYQNTLKQFLGDSGLSLNKVSGTKYDELEWIVSERIRFNEQALGQQLKDLNLNSAVTPINSKYNILGWNHSLQWERISSVPERFSALMIYAKFFSGNELMASFADRSFKKIDLLTGLVSTVQTGGGVVKNFARISGTQFYTCTIEGTLVIYDMVSEMTWEFKLPKRAVSFVKLLKRTKSMLCFYCGVDNTLNVCTLDLYTNLVEELDQFNLLSPCTCMEMVLDSDDNTLLFLTRQDFTQIMVFKLLDDKLIELAAISLNSAQFSTHSFNVNNMLFFSSESCCSSAMSDIQKLTPSTILAITTTHIPFMRLILVEIPDLESELAKTKRTTSKNEVHSILTEYISPTTPMTSSSFPVSQKTMFYDKILQNIATTIPQDAYSQPILKFVNSLNGLVVGSDNGIYGIDLQSSDSWLIKETEGNGRVKSMDFHGDIVCASFTNKNFVAWKIK